MKKRVIEDVVAMTLLFITLIAIISAVSMTVCIAKYKDDKYYVIGNDKIPSIYEIVGKRKLSIYRAFSDNGIEKYKYKYVSIKNVSSDLSKFTSELKENYNFAYTSDIDLSKDEGTVELSKNSVDKDKIIIIEINYNKNKYEIIISKGEGKINIYE